jgi:hypothetical protein
MVEANTFASAELFFKKAGDYLKAACLNKNSTIQFFLSSPQFWPQVPP